jgi:lipoate-protein ligase A
MGILIMNQGSQHLQRVEDDDLTPADHLARELELLDAVEAGTSGGRCRFWEAARPVVVVGRSTTIPDHVDMDACRSDGVDVLRRSSGGGAVVLAPGCLNYAVAVSLVSRPELMDVSDSFCIILGQIAASLGVPGVSISGRTDLALDGRKVSGNAQRRARRALLHHGTLLYGFDARHAARYLKEPARQPAYREGRCHIDFLSNLPCSAVTIRARLSAVLGCLGTGPHDSTAIPPGTGR